jgi:hypothetical protein
MNTQELKEQWQKQHLANNGQSDLVIKLFQESRHEKVKNNLNKLRVHSIIYMAFNLIMIIYSWLVLVENISNLSIVITAIIMLLLSKIVFYKNVLQLSNLAKIGYDEPVVKMQKVISQLKRDRIKHNRFIFIFSILYFWLAVFLVLEWDVISLISTVWANAPIVVITHLSLFFVWFPMAFWLLKKYDHVKSGSGFWSKMEKESFLTDSSVNSSLNNVLSFLAEIENFEKE